MLVEVFTEQHGRVGLVARGARGPKSRMRGLLEPFSRVLISWSGRGDLVTLTRLENAEPARVLSGEALVSALYLNEIVLKFCERRDPHPELYQAYAETLARLSAAEQIEIPLRIFEKRLLEAVGYGLELRETADTHQPVIAEQRYLYRLDLGPVTDTVVPGESDGPELGTAQRVSISGQSLLALQRESLTDPTVLRECKRLLRSALNAHLGHRTINARSLFRSSRTSAPTGEQTSDEADERLPGSE